jgi:hypothetical protein
MQPPGNIGSEPVETSRKNKSSKTAVTANNVAKNTKAQDILAKRKADAAKATLPSLAEKSTKLLKVNETLARRKAEAAKVAAAEREKKKVHDPSPAADIDKKIASKKRSSEATERGKRVTIKEKGPDDDEPSGKRARADPVAETDEDVDTLSCLRSNLVRIIHRRGQRGNRRRSHLRQVWPILRSWRPAKSGASAWQK